MIPPQFHGAWRRVSLTLDGGEPHESAQVVWVQTGTVFADLRVPLDGMFDEVAGAAGGVGPVSFAGTTRWEDPDLVWDHRLDSACWPAQDRGTMSWSGDDLVERGAMVMGGRPVPYIEVWHRLAGSSGPHLSLERTDGRGVLVRAGDHGVTVTDDRPSGHYRACYWTRDGVSDIWRPALALGPAADELPAPPLCGEDTPANWQVVDLVVL